MSDTGKIPTHISNVGHCYMSSTYRVELRGDILRDRRLSVRVDEIEHQLIEKNAKAWNMSVGEYLRYKALDKNIEDETKSLPLKTYNKKLNRTKGIYFRCSYTEKEIMKEEAKKREMTLQEFVLYATMNYKSVAFPENFKEDLKDLHLQILRLGNNINQLTKLANARIIKSVNLNEVGKSHKQIIQILNVLYDEMAKAK